MRIADLQFLVVGLVVHVPAKDNAAEAEARLGDGQELLLGHELASDLAIDIGAADLDAGVIFEQFSEVVVRELLGVVGDSHGGEGASVLSVDGEMGGEIGVSWSSEGVKIEANAHRVLGWVTVLWYSAGAGTVDVFRG